jgi:hypothetical protein
MPIVAVCSALQTDLEMPPARLLGDTHLDAIFQSGLDIESATALDRG